ncbi:MAG: GHKL domain-containing protein [Oscillospiraceae bacterium]|nr:GHKL domain-containing protein [Oscillospiraceae bacterium]
MYLIASLLLMVHNEKSSVRRKSLFAFFTGTILNNVWVYGMYFILGSVRQSAPVYLLITTANPIFALLYYVFGVKALKRSRLRSITLMSHAYLYYIIEKGLNRLIGSLFFVQRGDRYSYLLDICQQLTALAVVAVSYMIIRKLLQKHQSYLRMYDDSVGNYRASLTFYFIKAVIFYSLMVIIPTLVKNEVVANLLVLTVLILSLALYIVRGRLKMCASDLNYKDRHISALISSTEDFSGVKHDFYNILNTYSGYLETADWAALKEYHASLTGVTVHAGTGIELSRRLDENPAVVTLLLNKSDDAARRGVQMQLLLQCGLGEFRIDNVDLCRILACLFDNAIEAAADSAQKNVIFTATGDGESALMILSNATARPVDLDVVYLPGVTGKPGHLGIGVNTAEKIVKKYRNCALTFSYFDHEFTAYLDIKLPRI